MDPDDGCRTPSRLSPFIQGTRTDILAALQTCDFNALGWLGSGVPLETADWEPAMFATIEETLMMPFVETEGDFVWSKSAGVTSVDELTADDLELIRSRHEADPQDVVESPDEDGVVIISVDKTTARAMLLLPVAADFTPFQEVFGCRGSARATRLSRWDTSHQLIRERPAHAV